MADPITMFAGASLAMNAGSTIMGAAGQSAGATAQKQKAQKAAAIARVQADQADTAYRDELDKTLGNIDAIRASIGMADSPTSFALKDQAREDSDIQRTRKVAGLKMQATQFDEDARFYGSAARNYMMAGLVNAGGRATGGLSGMNFGSGGGSTGPGWSTRSQRE